MYRSVTDPLSLGFPQDGYTPGGVAMHEGGESFNWNVLVPFMHPTKVLVMEAFAYIGEPLSSTDLTKVLCGEKLTLSNISYHVGVLVKAEVLTLINQRRVRGSIETFYYFADS